MGLFDFFTGTPAKYEQVSNLTPQQLQIQNQLQNAAKRRGAKGAFGTSADYYRDLLSNENADMTAFSAPELRQFREQIVPDLAEQFAGMGSGGLSSSGFRNAAVSAGTDLSERLASIRAGLRQQAAQGLQNIGSQSLVPHSQYQQTQAGSEGFLSNMAPAIGTALGTAFGGPIGGAFGAGLGNLFKSNTQPEQFGSTSPYGNQSSGYKGSFGQLPQFGQR